MRLGSALRRGAWGLADQAASSLTNFIMSFAVLSGVSIEEFGAFTIAYSTYVLLLGIWRGAISETLVVRFSDAEKSEWRGAVAAATGVALPLGIVVAVVLAGAGAAIGGRAGPSLVALAVGLPGLMLQDVWRFGFFAEGTPAKAFANDVVWGVLQLGAAVAILTQGDAEASDFVLAWGLAGTFAGILGFAQGRLLPVPGRAVAWMREHRDLWLRYVLEAAFRRGAPQLTMVGIGAIAGLGALGQLNAARVLLGPLNIVFLGFLAIGVPEGVRIWRSRPHTLAPAVRLAAAVLGGLALVMGIVLLAVPTSLGEAVLDNWTSARTFLIPVSISVASAGATNAMIVGMRSLAAAERSFRAQIQMSTLIVFGGLAGAVIGGGWGAAIGLSIARAVSAGVASLAFETEMRERLSGLPREDTP